MRLRVDPFSISRANYVRVIKCIIKLLCDALSVAISFRICLTNSSIGLATFGIVEHLARFWSFLGGSKECIEFVLHNSAS